MTVINRFFRDENVATMVFTASMVSSGYFMGKNTVMMKWFRKWYQKYNPDNMQEPVPVKNVTTFRFDTVLDDLKVSKWDREYYKIFIAKDVLEPLAMGSFYTIQGVTVGIPEYFQHGTDEGIISTNILVDGKPVDWSSEDGQKLLQTFKLSEEAQKYILAKCVILHHNYYFIIQALLPTFVLVGGYAAAIWLYNKLKLNTRSDALTLLLYIGIASIFGFIYLFLADGIYLQYDVASEENISELGQGYLVGCLQYNQQLVARNKILRRMVKNGHRRYLENGDEFKLWYPIGLSPTIKTALCEERLQLDAEKEEMMKPPAVNPNPHSVL